MQYLLLEGMADRYENFLTTAANANLVEISEKFHFRIQTIEGPALLLRHVRTHGEATNHGEHSDAFYALMLSYPPGAFSSVDPLGDPARHPETPTLHWHLSNCSCINHHRDSKVIYLRLESASLLRVLSSQAIPVSQLTRLQGVAAPASLVQLIEDLSPQLSNADHQQHQRITEAFLNRLSQELRQLLGPPRPSDANAAAHASTAIERMMSQLSSPINLQDLATKLALTPRTLQGCFKSQLALSPMRWLKLARLSQLRQLLWDPALAHQSLQQLFGRCGLSDTNLNRISYREVYKVSPKEQRRLAESLQRQHDISQHESLHSQFDSLASAIQYLEHQRLIQARSGEQSLVAITITSSIPTQSLTVTRNGPQEVIS